jgi:DNA-binding CsgD family transcriptional regulator
MKKQEISPQVIQELEEELSFYKHLFDRLPTIIFENSIEEVRNLWSSNYRLPKLNYKAKGTTESARKFFAEKIHPNDLETARYAFFRHFQEREQEKTTSLVYRVKDQTFGYRWIYSRLARIPASSNVIGLAIDITDQFQSDQALLQAAQENLELLYQLQFEQLTKREQEVLNYLALGHTTKEIARHLHRSAKTIEKHRSSLLRKLDCRNVADLIRIANLAGWIKSNKE